MNDNGNNPINVNPNVGSVTSVTTDPGTSSASVSAEATLQSAPTVSTVTPTQVAPTVSASSTSGAATGQLQCDKCGAYYPSSQRYCMKCGALNYSHPDNQSMKQYINYDVINHSYVGNYKDKLSHDTFDPIIKMNRNCLIGSIIIHLILLAAVIGLNFVGIFTLNTTGLIILGVILVIMFLYNYSMARIYMHAGKDWWAKYIPVYSSIVYYNITMDSGWWFLLSCIPGIGQILSLVALYRLGTRFGKNGWLTLLFSMVMIPVIAFSNTTYAGSLKSMHMNLGDSEVDSKGRTKSEKKYGVKKHVIIFLVIIVLAVVVYFGKDIILEYGEKIWEFLLERYEETKEILGIDW